METAARHSDRIKVQIPIQVVVSASSGSHTFSAETVDASAYGARLRCTASALTVGEIVTIRCRQEECKFRIAWIGASGTPQQNQVGIECLEPRKNIWGIRFQDSSNPSEPELLECPWEVPQAS